MPRRGRAGSATLCLVLIGVSLAHYGMRGALRSAILLSLVKVIAHPSARHCRRSHWIFGLAGLPLAVVVMMAALPVGSNALIFAQRYDTLPAETSSAVVVSTLGFVLIALIWLGLLHAIG